jgi:hypothetical protein
MHTLLDLHGNIPTFIRVTDGKVHDVTLVNVSGGYKDQSLLREARQPTDMALFKGPPAAR